MRGTVVYGARQTFGFTLCSVLLEQGYVVYGIDHASWMNEEQRENWLNIGRNANLHYREINGEIQGVEKLSETELVVFIPMIDYISRNGEQEHREMVQHIKGLAESVNNLNTIVISPDVMDRHHRSFHAFSADDAGQEGSTGIHLEYFLSQNRPDHLTCYQLTTATNRSVKSETIMQLPKGCAMEKVAEGLVVHLEEKQVFE